MERVLGRRPHPLRPPLPTFPEADETALDFLWRWGEACAKVS
jgi:hypothetical protein